MQEFGPTIFAEMSALALETDSINLGQGFPDSDGPAELLEAARAAIANGQNQYPPGPGIPELRQAVAAAPEAVLRHRARPRLRSADHRGRDRGDRVGAARARRCRRRSDHVRALLRLVRGGRRPGRRQAADDHPARSGLDVRPGRAARRGDASHQGDLAEHAAQPDRQGLLARRSSPRSPSVAIDHDLLVITDEVYEHLVFDGEHVPISTLPGMAERTLTIGSAGKTFSVTGWKIGWASGPAELVERGPDGQAVPHLRQRGPVPAGGGAGPRLAGRLLPAGDGDVGEAAGSAVRRLGRAGLRRDRSAGDLLRHRPGRWRRDRVLPRSSANASGGGDPEQRLLRLATPGTTWSGSRSANVPKSSTKR